MTDYNAFPTSIGYKTKGLKTMEISTASAKKLPNILAIDDNVLLLRTVKEMLYGKYNVAIATSGNQAFDQLAIKTPDLILLDYEMPYQNGGDLFKKFKEDFATRNIPIIFFTGSSDLETVSKLLSLKPDGYMLKPPSKAKLVALIEKTLNKNHEVSE